MFKNIPVSDQTLMRLKRLAEPLEDTHDSVIRKLLDAYEAGVGPARREKTPSSGGHAGVPPAASPGPSVAAPPNLRHTKLTLAYVDGRPLQDPSWNRLVYEVVRYARERVDFLGLKRMSLANLVEGRKEEQGYHYIPEAGLSVQGQDSNGAWRTVSQIASSLGIDVEVDFVWRLKEGAERPGQSGHLSSRREP